MSKKLRLAIIAVLAFISCSCLFAGCTLKASLKDVLEDLNNKGNSVDVTYFSNEGSFNNKSDTSSDNTSEEEHEHEYKDGVCTVCGAKESISNTGKIRTLRYSVGSKAIDIGKTDFESGGISVTAADITRYELDGWYKAELDDNGNPVYEDGTPYKFEYDSMSFDSTKMIKHTGELFDFSTTLEKDTHYYLVAVWRKIQTVRVVLAGEVSSITVKTLSGETKTYKNGDAITDIAYETGGIIPLQQDALPGSTVENATFIEFYSKPTCNKDELFDGWPIYLKDHEDDDPENPYTIYAKYVENVGGSKWSVVKDISGVRDMFSGANSSANHYYLVKDIDCNNNLTVSARLSADVASVGFGCEIRGNYCKISNFKVTGTVISKGSTGSASLFGDIKATAKISNLILENVSQEYTVMENANLKDGIFFAFASIAEGASIEGVELSGTMTVKNLYGSYINNLVDGNESTNWIFGGYPYDGYTGGITVASSTTLTVISEN